MIAKDKICAVAAAGDTAGMWKQLSQALRVTRTVELRLDWLANEDELDRFLARLAKKRPRATLIATCRRRVAGGRFRGTIAQQLVHLASALRSGCAWYDLEVESSAKCPPELLEVLLGEGRRIASAHFFGSSPRNLQRVAADLGRAKPDAIKIAVRCDLLGRSLEVLRLARGRRNVIAVPMGEVALPARVLALWEGSALAYAPVENATAPGQVTLDTMKNLYRADKLRRKTRVYGGIVVPSAIRFRRCCRTPVFRRAKWMRCSCRSWCAICAIFCFPLNRWELQDSASRCRTNRRFCGIWT